MTGMVRTQRSHGLAWGAAALAAGLAIGTADAAVVSVSKAAIEGGRLVIQGKTAFPGEVVTVDVTHGTATSNATKDFTFSLLYLPPTCVVNLTANTIVRPFVVSTCGPRGLNPAGAWTNTRAYNADDVVTLLGSSYRSRTGAGNLNKSPPVSGGFWEVLAAKGAAGPQGVTGATGPQGIAGIAGPQGIAGATGPIGPQGPIGFPGATGPAGPQGTTGIVSFIGLGGNIGNPVAAGAVNYVFIGKTSTTTITATQAFIGSAALPLGLTTGIADFQIGLCYQLGAGPITDFNGGDFATASLLPSSGRATLAATGTVVPGVAGTYTVGACLRNFGAGALNNNDHATGWVIVTN